MHFGFDDKTLIEDIVLEGLTVVLDSFGPTGQRT